MESKGKFEMVQHWQKYILNNTARILTSESIKNLFMILHERSCVLLCPFRDVSLVAQVTTFIGNVR
jgi:hypothetical protein